jgi:hypothetical protein
MAVCCQNLMLDPPSSHSALSVLVGALFKKLDFFKHALYIFDHSSLISAQNKEGFRQTLYRK